jgi:hypothetical protein
LAERGLTRDANAKAEYGRTCGCREDFDHDGACQNAIREKKSMICQPCSQEWHLTGPCTEYVSKGYPTLTTQCDRCGWDSSEHT